jgi:hypothetical protein
LLCTAFAASFFPAQLGHRINLGKGSCDVPV